LTAEPISRRAVIVANGHLADPDRARQHIRPGDWIICADGGARHVRAMDLIPHVVVGDLDSLDPTLRADLEAAGVRFEMHPTRKDETDLELALHLAAAEGVGEVDVLGAVGGRLDQTLANLLLLTRPDWDSMRIRVIEDDEVAWLVHDGGTTPIEGSVGDTLSLVPLSPTVTGVTLQGVEWPLSHATLQLGSTLTISNVLAAPVAHLKIDRGLVLIVHRFCSNKEDEG
jgi:thiamine pyrophosphokinase